MSGFLARVSILVLLSTLSITNCIQFNYGVESEVLHTSDDRIQGFRSRENKDFVFGGLYPIHAPDPDSGGGHCGSRLDEGLELVEATLFAIDLINSDTELLSGLEIGYDARDTCASENIGLDEAVDLIITGSQLDIASSQCCSAMGTNTSTSINPPTSGVIGASHSAVSVPVAGLGRIFQMPQISYVSSSALLSNRDLYGYFYRTFPPDNQQARAMIDVLLKFNWTYVSAIHARTTYGEPGIEEFRALAEQHGICIDVDRGVDDDFDSTTITDLLIESSANVVIVFGTRRTITPILERIANTTSATRFTWIASDAWSRARDVTHLYNKSTAGMYGIAPLTDHVSHFHDYLSKLTINNNKRNPWFPEYFTTYDNCDLSNNGTNPCMKNQPITEITGYKQDELSPLVIDAVYAFAHALQNFLNDNCQMPIQWVRTNQSCVGQTRELNGSALLEYIAKLDFVNNITGNKIVFDSQGNVEGRYEILNYQAYGPVNIVGQEYKLIRVGIWDSSIANDSNRQALALDSSQTLQFGINDDKSIRFVPQPSQCGRCEMGQHRKVVQSSCCGLCEPCLGQTYSTDPMSPNCTMCPAEMWGNNPLVGSDSCVPIPESFIRYSDPFSIVVIILAILGLIAVLATTVIYIIFWKTPVVKSSGREQMITLLIGIGLIFILAFVYVSPPEPGVCAVQRVGFWICYSIIFGALLVKTVRVTRIFYRPGTLTRVRFTEPHYQVLFTSLIIIGQVVIVIIGLVVVNLSASRMIRRSRENVFPDLVVACVVDDTAILVLCTLYESILIVLSTILGVMSFKYPENFNEAKFVSFCTFIITIIWAAFVGMYAYFAVEGRQEIQNAITGLASVLSAYAVLTCLFGPKLFIIFFRSKQNKPGITKASASQDLGTGVNVTVISNAPAAQQFGNTLSTVLDDNSMNTSKCE